MFRSQVVLVDSGADANFTDATLVRKLGLTIIPMKQRLKATSLNGRTLWHVSQQTLQEMFNADHVEQISFFPYTSLLEPLILGYPWLRIITQILTGGLGNLSYSRSSAVRGVFPLTMFPVYTPLF